MHGDLRVVGAGLHAEVAVAARRVELVGGEVREPFQGSGSAVREPEPVAPVAVAEEPGTEAERQREPGGGQPAGLAGVARRGVVRRVLAVADRLPGGHRRGRRGPAFEQGDQLGPVLGGDVERGEVQPVLGGGDDPGLVLPVERHHRLGALVPGDERDATRGRGDADSGPGSHAEQAPA